MKVAVVKETRPGENRVALVPQGVKSLVESGLDVVVEAGAGHASFIADEEYIAAGAEVAPSQEAALQGADIVLRVSPPSISSPDEVAAIAPGTILVSFLNPFANLELVRRLAAANVTSLAMELVPRITRAQSMDALSSQATAAGYKAVLLAASHLPRFLPMFTTAAGTIRPAKALVLGAGVAGLQAIATARRLGAVVEAFDVRPAVKEQVESLGAKFLEAEHLTAEGEGGYAKELSADQHQRELDLIASAITSADVVIATAQIPGRRAPVLVTEAMVKTMRPGAVIVDLAAESGGNCELTRAGENVQANGVSILGPLNIAATIPMHASQMYSKNVVTLLGELVDAQGRATLDFADHAANDVVGPATLTHAGQIRHEKVRETADAAR